MRKTISDTIGKIAGTLFLSLVGFMMSRASVFGSYAPFGVAFAAAAPQGGAVFVTLGTALGYLLPGSAGSSVRYIAAVLAVSALRWLLSGFGKVLRYSAVPPVLSAAGVLASGLALSAPLGLTPYIVLMTAAESVLAAGGTFFFGKSIAVFRSSRRVGSLTQHELASVVITLGTLLLSVSGFEIAGISPGRILSCVLILCAARYGQAAGGSIAGVTVGLMLSLSGGEMNPFSGVYAFGGLMAGLFAPVGRLAPALAFAAAAGISALRIGGGAQVFAGLYEGTIGAAVFVLLPERLLGSVRPGFRAGDDSTDADSLRHSVVMRLGFASKALAEVSDAVDSVTKKLGALCAPNISSVYERCSDTVCRTCGLKMFCWGPAYHDTQSALNDMTQVLRAQGAVAKEDVPQVFARRCCHLTDLLTEINQNYHDFTIREGAERRISEVRAVVADQFDGLSSLLGELSHEFEETERFDRETAAKASAMLEQYGVEPVDVCCRMDRYGRMTVTASVKNLNSATADRATLIAELSHACGRSFEKPCIAWAGEEAQITLHEKAEFTMELGCAQHNAGDAQLCGDAYECFFDGRGRVVMMISDGMGSGGRAAVEGAMAAGILSRLIKAGFGFSCALGIVNSSLLVKSGDEALATLDVSCLDLYTGRLQVLKAGAPMTLIKRGSRVVRCDPVSLPVGILRDVSFEQNEFTLNHGDIILMLSDGALYGGSDWLETELFNGAGLSAQQLAEQIAEHARKRRLDGKDDDITVLVGKVQG